MNEEREYAHLDPLFEEYKHIATETIFKMFPRPKVTAKRLGIDLEDLFQYAYTGLWKACITYKADKGTKFKTHAINHIRWHVNERTKRECHLFKLEANKKYTPEELPQFLSFDYPMDQGNGLEPTFLHDVVDSGVYVEAMAWEDIILHDIFGDTLTEKDQQILSMRIQEKELKDIGKVFGQTGEYMGHRIKKLKPKMKKYLEVI